MTHESEDRERDSKDDDAIRALLKRSAAAPVKNQTSGTSETKNEALFLRGVQARIRKRSRGRFFADGWSTSDARINYALVAMVMLVVIAVAWIALGPMGVTK